MHPAQLWWLFCFPSVNVLLLVVSVGAELSPEARKTALDHVFYWSEVRFQRWEGWKELMVFLTIKFYRDGNARRMYLTTITVIILSIFIPISSVSIYKYITDMNCFILAYLRVMLCRHGKTLQDFSAGFGTGYLVVHLVLNKSLNKWNCNKSGFQELKNKKMYLKNWRIKSGFQELNKVDLEKPVSNTEVFPTSSEYMLK